MVIVVVVKLIVRNKEQGMNIFVCKTFEKFLQGAIVLGVWVIFAFVFRKDCKCMEMNSK